MMWMRVLLLVAATLASAPAQETARLSFEVASIKPSPPPPEGGVALPRYHQTAGSIDYSSVSLFNLILRAYAIEDYQLQAPPGLDRRWNIQARLPDGATTDQIFRMLQTLMAERFGLKVHHESKEITGYALLVAKGGPHLTEVQPPEGGLGAGPSPTGGRTLRGRVRLPVLAKALSLSFPTGRELVVDMTGLQGIYDISVDYTPEQPSTTIAGLAATPGPGMIEAVQQTLGLKLERRKLSVDMLVVDHIQPTPLEN